MLVEVDNKKTVNDYEKLPEGAPYQLINGELIMSPSPDYFHQKLVLNLALKLQYFIDNFNSGEIIIAPMDVHFSGTEIFQPDILFISNDKKSIIQDRIRGVPDLVVEILSPGTAYYDLTHKKNVYESSGVLEYWIIDPEEKRIEILENTETGFKTFSKAGIEGIVTSKIFKGFSLLLNKIF
jgi:Uma2 family endonuclease